VIDEARRAAEAELAEKLTASPVSPVQTSMGDK
jgi:hypothetical protein